MTPKKNLSPASNAAAPPKPVFLPLHPKKETALIPDLCTRPLRLTFCRRDMSPAFAVITNMFVHTADAASVWTAVKTDFASDIDRSGRSIRETVILFLYADTERKLRVPAQCETKPRIRFKEKEELKIREKNVPQSAEGMDSAFHSAGLNE